MRYIEILFHWSITIFSKSLYVDMYVPSTYNVHVNVCIIVTSMYLQDLLTHAHTVKSTFLQLPYQIWIFMENSTLSMFFLSLSLYAYLSLYPSLSLSLSISLSPIHYTFFTKLWKFGLLAIIARRGEIKRGRKREKDVEKKNLKQK